MSLPIQSNSHNLHQYMSSMQSATTMEGWVEAIIQLIAKIIGNGTNLMIHEFIEFRKSVSKDLQPIFYFTREKMAYQLNDCHNFHPIIYKLI